eukprot:SAG25_NODE_3552_length_1043_cov_23.381356_1_plen_37_part_10
MDDLPDGDLLLWLAQALLHHGFPEDVNRGRAILVHYC